MQDEDGFNIRTYLTETWIQGSCDVDGDLTNECNKVEVIQSFLTFYLITFVNTHNFMNNA